jgi:hypothetical protein
MNDSMSILLATTILALGGLGLYMYKSENDEYKDDNEEYNEDSMFGGNFWGFGETDNKNDDDEEFIEEGIQDDMEEERVKPRRRNVKTHRNRKSTGTSRRRY